MGQHQTKLAQGHHALTFVLGNGVQMSILLKRNSFSRLGGREIFGHDLVIIN
jgi:hypothetical protein